MRTNEIRASKEMPGYRRIEANVVISVIEFDCLFGLRFNIGLYKEMDITCKQEFRNYQLWLREINRLFHIGLLSQQVVCYVTACAS